MKSSNIKLLSCVLAGSISWAAVADIDSTNFRQETDIRLSENSSDEFVRSALGWLSDRASRVMSSALEYTGLKPFIRKFGATNLRALARILEESNAKISLETLTWLGSTIYNTLLTSTMTASTGYTTKDVPTYADELKAFADSTAKTMIATMVSRGWLAPEQVKSFEVRLAGILRSMAEKLSSDDESAAVPPPKTQDLKPEPSPLRAE